MVLSGVTNKMKCVSISKCFCLIDKNRVILIANSETKLNFDQKKENYVKLIVS